MAWADEGLIFETLPLFGTLWIRSRGLFDIRISGRHTWRLERDLGCEYKYLIGEKIDRLDWT